jgi:hypothetical protein
MATKKQKREMMQRRRAEFEAEIRETGLAAQKADRERRKAEEARMWDDAHKVHLKRNRFHDKCPNCAKVKAQQAMEKLAKAARVKEQISAELAMADMLTPDDNTGISPVVFTSEHTGDNTPIDLTRVEKVSA